MELEEISLLYRMFKIIDFEESVRCITMLLRGFTSKNEGGNFYAFYDYCQSLKEFVSKNLPNPEFRKAIMKYNNELVKAGES